jgi:hypothetical protein
VKAFPGKHLIFTSVFSVPLWFNVEAAEGGVEGRFYTKDAKRAKTVLHRKRGGFASFAAFV